MRLELLVEEERLGVCRLGSLDELPEWVPDEGFCSVTRTREELSIVCAEDVIPVDVRCERGWRMLRVAGTQAFTLTGVLSSVLEPLARAGASIFAISTFDTDYVLVKAETLERAVAVLRESGHSVI